MDHHKLNPIHLLYDEHGWLHCIMASFQVPSRLMEALPILPGLGVEAPRRIPPPHMHRADLAWFKPFLQLPPPKFWTVSRVGFAAVARRTKKPVCRFLPGCDRMAHERADTSGRMLPLCTARMSEFRPLLLDCLFGIRSSTTRLVRA